MFSFECFFLRWSWSAGEGSEGGGGGTGCSRSRCHYWWGGHKGKLYLPFLVWTQTIDCCYIHPSSKETQLFWTHFSRWPWVTDPDPGSCTFCQLLSIAREPWTIWNWFFTHCYQEHWQNEIHYKVHLSTLFPKRNATSHAAFLLKKSVHIPDLGNSGQISNFLQLPLFQ